MTFRINDNVRIVVPGWVRQSIRKMLDKMNANNCDAMVSYVALLGKDGYDLSETSYSPNLDVSECGPMMHEGSHLVAGGAIAKMAAIWMSSCHGAGLVAAAESEMKGESVEAIGIMRDNLERMMLESLVSCIEYAASNVQENIDVDPAVIAMSQVFGKWRTVMQARIDSIEQEYGDGGETK